PYSDTHKVSAWALPSVSLAHGLGLMQGSEGTFEPKSNATRAQVATVVLRAMERMGLISANTSLKGVVGISEIEGRHFELSEGKNTYVLVPKGEAIAAQLEAFVGKETEVTGELQQGVSSYMRGPVLEVFWVDGKAKLPGG
ncbi:MAG: S-layer homology domain-containing protein, partial [bacterium]